MYYMKWKNKNNTIYKQLFLNYTGKYSFEMSFSFLIVLFFLLCIRYIQQVDPVVGLLMPYVNFQVKNPIFQLH